MYVTATIQKPKWKSNPYAEKRFKFIFFRYATMSVRVKEKYIFYIKKIIQADF